MLSRLKNFIKNTFRFQRKSLVISISVTFWLIYVILGGVQIYDNLFANVEEEYQRSLKRLEFVMTSSQPSLAIDNTEALNEIATDALQKGLIDFYVLRNEDRILKMKYREGVSPEVLAGTIPVSEELQVAGEYTFAAAKIGPHLFALGLRFNKAEWMRVSFQKIAIRYFVDLFLVTLAMFFIVKVLTQDIVQLSKALSSGSLKKLRRINSTSKEAEILLNATETYEEKTFQLAQKNTTYEGSIGPALVEEIRLGKPAPYSFHSTMVRVDLNGYTQIFFNKNEEYITSILNQYFTKAREIINRYNGLIYQYVGDEIVFHIKGDAIQTQKLALGCLRSLFEAADEIQSQLPAGADHCFKLKASFVYSPIRFVKLDRAYALSGVSLIESARLLSQIDEKTINMLAFSESEFSENADAFSSLCQIQYSRETQLKGFSQIKRIHFVSRFHDFSTALSTSAAVDNFEYFRSDSDLVLGMSYLRQLLREGNESAYFQCLGKWRNFKVSEASAALVTAYTEHLNELSKRNRQREVSDRAMASWIAIATYLVPPRSMTQELAEALQSHLYHVDHRIQANTIIVLGELAEDISLLKKFILSKNNRVSADALYTAGKRELTKETASLLLQHAQSDKPLFKAGALWVMRQLLNHYEDLDPVFFNTNPYLEEFRQQIQIADREKLKVAG